MNILIASAAYNWAETHRMVSIGLELKKLGYCVYSLGIGAYDYMLQEDFHYLTLDYDTLWYNQDRIHRLMNMDQYGNDYCTKEELNHMVQMEMKLLQDTNIIHVITGYRTTLTISCKILNIPLTWVLSAVVSPLYYKNYLATMPEFKQVQYIKDIKEKALQNKYYSTLVLKNNSTSSTFIQVMKEYGLSPFKSDISIFEGNLNLMSDAKELFSHMKSSMEHYKFIGPLFNKETIEMPEFVREIKQTDYTNHKDLTNQTDITVQTDIIDQTDITVQTMGHPEGIEKSMKTYRVFITMGSSGTKGVLIKLLDALIEVNDLLGDNRKMEYYVATTSIVSREELVYPDNFYFAKAYPHREMAEWVDCSIIHGGQGTLYTTLLAGKPYIGIPMFSEQQYNLENASSLNSSIILHPNQINSKLIMDILLSFIETDSYRMNAISGRELMLPYVTMEDKNPSKVGAEFIHEYITDHSIL